ncbi:hypothetical protein ACWTU6_27380 [Mesorhizobium sp. BHbsci]
MLIKVCPQCTGDGFRRFPINYIDDRYDIADATKIASSRSLLNCVQL